MGAETAALLSAASGPVNALIGAGVQGLTNRKNRKFALKMWNLQNEYNTPLAQMDRLRAAGLNPNLVYGGGMNNTASSPDVPQGRMDFDMGNPVQNYLQSRSTQQGLMAQQQATDNMAKANEKMSEEIAQIRANVMATLARIPGVLTENQIKDFRLKFDQDSRDDMLNTIQQRLTNMSAQGAHLSLDYDTKKQLQKYTIAFNKLRNNKLGADIKFTQEAMRRANEMHPFALSEFTQRTYGMKQQQQLAWQGASLTQAQIDSIKNSINNANMTDSDKALLQGVLNKLDPSDWRPTPMKR